jgi:glutaconate CoA-transferase subunit B
VTTFSSRLYLYVPRHNRAVFVEKLDFRSGLGHLSSAERERLGLRAPGPRYLVSNLGQFDFANGRMRLITHHPGVTVESIQKKTGFALEIAPNVHETTPPSGEEVRLLREEIDPLGIRELEILSGPRRRAKLREIIAREGQQSSQPED